MEKLLTRQRFGLSCSSARVLPRATSLLIGAAGLAALTGCGGMVNMGTNDAQPGIKLGGVIHGGQQPVVGSTIQLYAAQATGYGAAALPLISSTVKTDANGNFGITGTYTCPASPNDQVYLLATGGDAGAGNNANFSEMAALGPCSGLSAASFVVINEVTTIASVYALSGFMTDSIHVGSSSTNYLGLKNAFATANNLVDVTTGTARSVTPAYGVVPATAGTSTFRSSVPQAELNTLANVLASCVNTNGVGGSSNACTSLFNATKPGTASAATDTTTAALYIAQNPGANVATLYNLAGASAPFTPTMSSAPSDWTVALNFVSGGLGGTPSGTPISKTAQSNQLAIDGSGNVWVADLEESRVTELNNLGAPLSPTSAVTPVFVAGGYSGGGLSNPTGIAIDLNGNAWVANNSGALAELSSNGSPVGTGYTGGGLVSPVRGLAIDGSNNIWAVSGDALSKFDNSGNPLSGTGYTNNISSVTGAIALDNSGDVWLASGGNKMAVAFTNNGSLMAVSGAYVDASGPYAAVTGAGHFMIPNAFPDQNVQDYKPNGTLNQTYSTASINAPTGIAVDGLGNLWVASQGGGTCGSTCTVPANLTEYDVNGNLISPLNTGYLGTGTGLFNLPKGLGIDMSGNVWIANGTNLSTVTEFIGAAAPAIAPLALAVKNAAIGTRP